MYRKFISIQLPVPSIFFMCVGGVIYLARRVVDGPSISLVGHPFLSTFCPSETRTFKNTAKIYLFRQDFNVL